MPCSCLGGFLPAALSTSPAVYVNAQDRSIKQTRPLCLSLIGPALTDPARGADRAPICALRGPTPARVSVRLAGL